MEIVFLPFLKKYVLVGLEDHIISELDDTSALSVSELGSVTFSDGVPLGDDGVFAASGEVLSSDSLKSHAEHAIIGVGAERMMGSINRCNLLASVEFGDPLGCSDIETWGGFLLISHAGLGDHDIVSGYLPLTIDELPNLSEDSDGSH